MVKKGFFAIPEKVVTKVFNHVSKFVPDQALPLRDLLLQFSYLGEEKMAEIVNRGFDGDEDDGLLGVDVSQLDFSEVHDRMIDMRNSLRMSAPADAAPVDAAPADAAPADAAPSADA